MPIPFKPSPDVTAILDRLLDIYERRDGAPRQAVRVKLEQLDLPGYHSQIDPAPRVVANEQMAHLERAGLVHLAWLPGEAGHLLAAVTLDPGQTGPLYHLLAREPLAELRRRLRNLLLAERFRLDGWRLRAVDHCLAQLRDHKSPAPFSLADTAWNRDLLDILAALPGQATTDEVPYRTFSVRLFNDSKRFEPFKDTVARLARRHQPAWRPLSAQETLREMGLVPNPGHLYLSGAWQLVDADGQATSLANFWPSAGIPAALAGRLCRVGVDAERVVCVENLASFYELVRYEGRATAALCLWGNPSPAARHLLCCLAETLPPAVPLLLWADIDYGGLNILAQLRQHISPRFAPYRMDPVTLSAHARWARPLTPADERRLSRLRQHAALPDMVPLIDAMLLRGLKLEQEAVTLLP